MITVIIDLGLDPELLELVPEIETELYKEVHDYRVRIYAENEYQIASIQSDIEKLLDAAKRFKKIYETVNLPSEAIEIIRSEGHEHHKSGSGSTYWTSH